MMTIKRIDTDEATPRTRDGDGLRSFQRNLLGWLALIFVVLCLQTFVMMGLATELRPLLPRVSRAVGILSR